MAARPSRIRDTTAHEAFKRRQTDRTCIGLLGAVALHVAFLLGFPALTAHDGVGEEPSMEVLELPPQVVVPPPPERIAQPAEPVPGDIQDPEATIPKNAGPDLAPRALPAPPRIPAAADRPRWIPRDVDPRALNDGEITRLLQRLYPPGLRAAGIGGRVTLWLFVDAEGRVDRVHVQEASRYEAFDSAAVAVAKQMNFAPARSGDRPIGVWVQRTVTFRTR